VSEITDIMLQIVEGHLLYVPWSLEHPTDSRHMVLDGVNEQATKDDWWMICSPKILLKPLLYYCLYGQLTAPCWKNLCSAQYLDLKKMV
jgi:hypothetical protein